VVRLFAVFLGARPAAVPRRVHLQPVIAEQVQQTVAVTREEVRVGREPIIVDDIDEAPPAAECR
jgi:hypothetical protein